MYVNSPYSPVAAAASSKSNDSSSSSTNSADTTGDMFMQLLITQLQNQSPLNPVDPNQFVGQMVQFNTLNQIVGIRQLLEQLASSAGSPTGSVQPVQGGQ
jgi:flagellar basal-body rod modification protein FlgD